MMAAGEDPIGALQDDFVALWTALYSGLGVLQRDAPPRKLATGAEAANKDDASGDLRVEARRRLEAEIAAQSQKIGERLEGLPAKLVDAAAEPPPQRIAQLVASLPRAIQRQEERIAALKERSRALQDLFRQLMLARRQLQENE